MSNAKKHDLWASEGARRATENAPESSATAGGGAQGPPDGLAVRMSIPLWTLGDAAGRQPGSFAGGRNKTGAANCRR
jgi:hypothetical protein